MLVQNVTHLLDGMREILIPVIAEPVIAEADRAPHTVEGVLMITLTHLGDVVAATEERTKY